MQNPDDLEKSADQTTLNEELALDKKSKKHRLDKRWFTLACLLYVGSLFMPCLHFGTLAAGDQGIGSYVPNMSQQTLGVTCLVGALIGPSQSNTIFENFSRIGWFANPMVYLAFWIREYKPAAAVSWAAFAFFFAALSLLLLFVEQFFGPADKVWHLHYGVLVWLASMFLFFMAYSANYDDGTQKSTEAPTEKSPIS